MDMEPAAWLTGVSTDVVDEPGDDDMDGDAQLTLPTVVPLVLDDVIVLDEPGPSTEADHTTSAVAAWVENVLLCNRFKPGTTTALTKEQGQKLKEIAAATKEFFLSTMNENGMSAFVEDESYPRRKRRAEQHTKNMDAGRVKLPARKRKNEDKRGK